MRIMSIGDLHFGERGDSRKFNSQILDFLNWATGICTEYKIDKIIQLGDWFHHRNKIQVETLTYGIEGAKILSTAVGKENVMVLAGNHDLFYLDRLDVSSISSIDPYVTVIDKPTVIENIVLTPWVATQEQWEEVVRLGETNKFLFAHLELNGFLVNDNYEMEHGFSHRELRDYELVVTGHYHSMQTKDNILYTGTPYPITMNEANEKHGVVIIDTETDDIQFIEYTGISVISINFDEIEKVLEYDPETTSVRIEFPDVLDDESIIEEVRAVLKEKGFDEVKIKYRGEKAKKLVESEVDDVEFVENIDEAVIIAINKSVDIDGIDKELLAELYNQAATKEIK